VLALMGGPSIQEPADLRGNLPAGILPPLTLRAEGAGYHELAALWNEPPAYPTSLLTMRRRPNRRTRRRRGAPCAPSPPACTA